MSPMLGAALRAVAGIALLSLMDAVIKLMTERFAVVQVTFLRFAFGLVFAGLLLAAMRPGRPSRELVIANAGRAVLAVLTATSFFTALSLLPLAETLVLSFVSPIFVALFGVVMLRERVDGRVIAALAVGFAGVLVVVSDQLGAGSAPRSTLGIAAALVSAVCYALALVLLRARAQRDPLAYIVAFQNMGPALILGPIAAFFWRAPTPAELGLFAIVGALGVSGHVLLTLAFARAEAARLAPLEYTALIWGVVYGYGFFGEVPTLATLAGAALIVAGAVVSSRR